MPAGPVVIYADCLSNRGGTGVYTRRLLRGLTEIGAENVLVAAGDRLMTPGEATELDPGTIGWRKTLREHHSLRRLATSASPGLIHLPAFSGSPPAGVPFVMTLHDLAFLREPSWFPRLRSIYYRLRFTRLALNASLLMVDSDFTADEAVNLLGLPAERLRRIYLSTGSFEADPVLFREVSHVSGPYIIFVGTVEPRKNIGALLDAWELVKGEHPDLSLVIAGRWGWGPSSLKHRLGSAERVVWTGALESGVLASAVSGARLLVYPSLYEGFGLPPLEAASAGIPSVVTPAGALKEIFSGIAGVSGSFSGESIANCILEALDCPPHRQRLRDFASGFSSSVMAGRVLDVYRELAP